MKTQVELAYSSAEAAASEVTSASCYYLEEHVGIVPVVEAELKLIQVERRIGFAHLVIRSDNSAFEQTPKAFDRVSVNHATNVLARTLADDLMRQTVRAFTEQAIAGVFICGDKLDFLFV